MQPLSSLVHAHIGQPGMIMGGGDSLPAHAARAPERCVFLSANQHGCLLRKCDYLVVCDDKPGRRFAAPNGPVDLKSFGTPIISPRTSMADYRVFERPVPNNSGVVGAWILWVMGCSPILLAGMDCYAGGTYWHSPKADSSGRGMTRERHLFKWEQLRNKFPDAPFRVMGGPLAKLFPVYDPAERIEYTWPRREDVREAVSGKRVRVVRPWRHHPAGEQLEVSVIELTEGQREGKLVLL